MTLDARVRSRIVEDCFAIIFCGQAKEVRLYFTKIPGNGALFPNAVCLEAIQEGTKQCLRASIGCRIPRYYSSSSPLSDNKKALISSLQERLTIFYTSTMFSALSNCAAQDFPFCEIHLLQAMGGIVDVIIKICYSHLVFLTPH